VRVNDWDSRTSRFSGVEVTVQHLERRDASVRARQGVGRATSVPLRMKNLAVLGERRRYSADPYLRLRENGPVPKPFDRSFGKQGVVGSSPIVSTFALGRDVGLLKPVLGRRNVARRSPRDVPTPTPRNWSMDLIGPDGARWLAAQLDSREGLAPRAEHDRAPLAPACPLFLRALKKAPA